MFVDESGNPNLKNIDKEFPVFVLCGVMLEEQSYYAFRDDFNELKLKFFDNKDVVFHSTKIRKRNKDFKILIDTDVKQVFIEGLNACIYNADFTIISVAVDKREYVEEVGHIDDLYEICLSVLVERTIHYLSENKLDGGLSIVLERRGKKEDNVLVKRFNKILDSGTFKATPEEIKSFNTGFHFRKKNQNINGLQLADLVAYPIARQTLNPETEHPSFKVFKDKFYYRGDENRGWKKIPKK